MKKRIISLLLALTLIVGMIPLTAVSSYASDGDSIGSYLDMLGFSKSEKRMAENLWNALMKILGSDAFDEAFDDATTLETFSRLKGDKTYTNYLNLGDSTTFGYGLGTMAYESWDFNNTYGWGKSSEKSWAYLLAEKLKLKFPKNEGIMSTSSDITPWHLSFTDDNHFVSLAVGLGRTWEFNNLITGNEKATDKLLDYCFTDFLNTTCMSYVREDGTIAKACVGDEVTFDLVRPMVQNAVKEADLITVSLGGNDTWSAAWPEFQTDLYELYGGPFENWDYIKELFPGSEALIDVVSTCLYKLMHSENLGALETTLSGVVDGLLYATLGILGQYPVILDSIHEMNEDADIVILGLFNPYEPVLLQSELTNNETIRVGKVTSVLIAFINRYYRMLAKERSSYCAYVDTMGTELIGEVPESGLVTNNDLNYATNPNVVAELEAKNYIGGHESVSGHIEILNKVYKALYPEKTSSLPAENHLVKVRSLAAFLNGEGKSPALTLGEQAVSAQKDVKEKLTETRTTLREESSDLAQKAAEVIQNVVEKSVTRAVTIARSFSSYGERLQKDLFIEITKLWNPNID